MLLSGFSESVGERWGLSGEDGVGEGPLCALGQLPEAERSSVWSQRGEKRTRQGGQREF